MLLSQAFPILGQPQADRCSQLASSEQQPLLFLFTLEGKNALGFAKDLSQEIKNWQLTSAESFHQKILDLLLFCHQEKLEMSFATLASINGSLALASSLGEIFLKRKDEFKKLIEGKKEIQFLIGRSQNGDQFQLFIKNNPALLDEFEKIIQSEDQERKITSSLQEINQKNNDALHAAVFIHFQGDSPIRIQKHTFKKSLFIFLKKSQKLGKKIFQKSKEQFFIFKEKIKKTEKKLLIRWIVISTSLFLLLILSIFLWKRQNLKKYQRIETKIQNIMQEEEQIRKQVAIQPLLARNSAENLLVELQKLKEERTNSQSKRLIDEKIKEVELLIEEISGENQLDRLQVAIDLREISENFLGKKIRGNARTLSILENEGDRILQINLENNEHSLFENPTGKEIRDYDVIVDDMYLLGGGIWQKKLSDNTVKQLKEEGDSDRSASIIRNFSDYIYLVNPDKRNIYRYYYNNGELSEAIGWLIEKDGIRFNTIQDMMIDGDLWLSFDDGSIWKYTRGRRVDFNPQGLTEKFSSPLLIDGRESTNKIVILEKSKKRLVILNKDGAFLNEIQSNELAGVNDIYYDPDSEKVFALSGSIVYQISVSI